MLALAWYPHIFFSLSFGAQDQTAAILDKLDFSLEVPHFTSGSGGLPEYEHAVFLFV